MENEERAVFRIATPFLWWVIYEEGQRWTILRVLNVLCFLLLSPLLAMYFILALPFGKIADRSLPEVIEYLSNEIEGRSGYRDWDDFTSVPIQRPELEALRCEAAMLGVGELYKSKLLGLLERAQALAIENSYGQ